MKKDKVILYTVFYVLAIVPLLNVFNKTTTNQLEQIQQDPHQLTNLDVIITSWQYIIILYFVGLGLLYLAYVNNNRFKRDGIEHGSARWGEHQEYANIRDKNGFIINHTLTMSLDSKKTHRNNNALIIGGSGTMKTRAIVIPNILQMNTSFIITDPKGEIYKQTSQILQRNGYKIKILNLIDIASSTKYNPLNYIKKVDDILSLVNNFIENTTTQGTSKGDPFWENSEKALFQCLIGYLFEFCPMKDRNFSNILELIKMATPNDEQDNYTPFDLLMDEAQKEYPESFAVKNYKIFKQAQGQTRSSILVTAAVRLNPFNIPAIENLTASDEINLGQEGDEKTAFFIIISDTDTTYNFLVGMLYTQLFQRLIYKADNQKNRRLKHDIQFYLDEFANIGKIPEFDKKISTIRSRGLSVKIILQTITQLKSNYKNTWETIIGNCDTIIFLGGNEEVTLKYISNLLGKQTVDVLANTRVATNIHSKSSLSSGAIGRNLLTFDEISRFDNLYNIAIIRGYFPLRGKKFDMTRHKYYPKMIDYNKAENNMKNVEISIVPKELMIDNKTENHTKTKVNLQKEELSKMDLLYEIEAELEKMNL